MQVQSIDAASLSTIIVVPVFTLYQIDTNPPPVSPSCPSQNLPRVVTRRSCPNKHKSRQHKPSLAFPCGAHPLLGAVVLGRGRSVRRLRAEWHVLLQGGLLAEGGVAHVLIDGVDGHLGDVLGRLRERKKDRKKEREEAP